MTGAWEALHARFSAEVGDPLASAPDNLYWLVLVHGAHLLADERFEIELPERGSSRSVLLRGPNVTFVIWEHHGEGGVEVRAHVDLHRHTTSAWQYLAASTERWPESNLTTAEQIAALGGGRDYLMEAARSDESWLAYLAKADRARAEAGLALGAPPRLPRAR